MEVPEVKRLKSLEEDSRSCLPKPCLIKFLCDATDLSQRRACRLTGLTRSTCRYEAQRPPSDAHLSGRITELALERRHFGYSYCAVKAFMLITSACTAFII